MPSTLDVMGGGRHFERVDWHPNRTRPPDLGAWPFTIPGIAQIIADGGFDVPAGVTFLVGENGSGKSTLIEALAASYPRHGHWSSWGNTVGPEGSHEDSELHWHLRARASARSTATTSSTSSLPGAPTSTPPTATSATS